ncbi:MAG: HAD family hydrolase [Clostridia bacterium]|nr:HAD family hydrolase [Clostridia bacterium]
MKYSTVIFDLDGTLLDTLSDLADAVNHTLSVFGKKQVTSDDVRRFTGYGAGYLISKASGVSRDDESFGEILDYYLKYYREHANIKTAPYPGVIELVDSLRERGVKCGLLSNKPDPAVQVLIDLYFPGVFDFVSGEREGITPKPDPSGINTALSVMGGDKITTLYVGDSESDVIAARNAEVAFAGVTWGFRDRDVLEAEGAEIIADNCDELFAACL